jgi:cell division septation protein DedD
MDKYLLQLLKEIKTIIIPGLGALTLTNEEKGEILFMPYLKFDDGKLATHIAEREGMSVQHANNLIAKYVREIEATLNKGESYVMYQFGSFFKQDNGTIAFNNWGSHVLIQRKEPTKEHLAQSPEIVATQDQVTEATISVQKTYEATQTYSEEDQWNDDLELPPINHTVERPKKPILEKTKQDRPKKKIGLVVGISFLLLLIGGSLILALFYNTAERTMHQVASKVQPKQQPEQNEQSEVTSTYKKEEQLPQESESNATESEAEIAKETKKEQSIPAAITAQQTSTLKKYHIIMGAFRKEHNAENYVVRLNQQGATSVIVTQMEGLYLVSYGSYTSPEERASHLADAREISPKAWLMIFP